VKDFPLFLVELNETTPAAFDKYWFWSCRDDSTYIYPFAYISTSTRLSEISSITGIESKRIFMLISPRYFGFNFNPLTMYFSCDNKGNLETMIAEYSMGNKKVHHKEICNSTNINSTTLDELIKEPMSIKISQWTIESNLEEITQEKLNWILFKGAFKSLYGLLKWV